MGRGAAHPSDRSSLVLYPASMDELAALHPHLQERFRPRVERSPSAGRPNRGRQASSKSGGARWSAFEAQQLCAAGMDWCTSKLDTVATLAEGRGEAAEEVVAPPRRPGEALLMGALSCGKAERGGRDPKWWDRSHGGGEARVAMQHPG